MKLRLFTLPCLLFLLITIQTQAQTIWTETFDGNDSTYFTLNTFDNGCAGPTAFNIWAINKDYAGGTGQSSVYCALLGEDIPDGLSESTTDAEPAGISNPNGYYLHILDPSGYTATPTPIACADFIYADGECVLAQNSFCRMNTDVSTVGYTALNLKFWWLCKGGANHYANIFYSTDQGGIWTQFSPAKNYSGQPDWALDSIALPPAALGQTYFRIGFMWVNNVNSTELDPSFAVDDISIEVPTTTTTPTITTGTIIGSPFCPGQTISVPFTTTGTITGSYTVELSNATGSFVSSIAIGTGTTSPINATIPAGTTFGSGYEVEVVNGSATVTPSASFTINAASPTAVTISSSSGNTLCVGSSTTFSASLTGGGSSPTYQWKVNNVDAGTDSVDFTPASLTNGAVISCTVTSNAACATGSPAPSNDITMTVTTAAPVTISISASPGISVCPGTTITYSSDVSGGGPSPTYQWQDSGKSISGATNATYVDNTPYNDDKITCIVHSNSPCVTGTPVQTSNEIDITVSNGGVTAGTISTNGSDTICTKTIASLSLVGYTSGDNIQWQSSTTMSGFTNISGATSANYNSTLLGQTTYYTVVVSNNSGCSANSNVVKISVVPPPSGSFTYTAVGPTATFSSDSITGATGYSWNFADGSPLNSQANPVHTFDSTNVPYDVCLTVTNSSNCNNTICQNVTVFPLGINNVTLGNGWLIYPDPFTNQLYINSSSTAANVQQIEIYDVLGRIVLQQKMNGLTQQPFRLDVSSLKEGVYFLRIDSPEGSVEKSVIKQ